MLSLLGWFYGYMADLRNAFYDRGVFRSHSLGARTISIGNITTGGTGKTPLVAYVAKLLAEKGEKVCILTRGYGRSNPRNRVLVSDGERVLVDVKTGGDEPIELARKLLGKAIIISDANRVSAANWAREKFGITAFVLDDGFQHRRVRRDLDIVCIDATNPFGNRKMLPAGILREPLHNLERANAIVITKANLSENIENLKSEISKLNPDCPVFVCANKISSVIELEEFHAKTQRTQEEDGQKPDREGGCRISAFAFCALGNPNNFFEELRRGNFDLTGSETFRDHHFYTQNNIDKLEHQARQSDAEILLTTAKDAVKLKDLKFEIPCFVAEIEPEIKDAEAFRELL